jgi:hypothetical protein
VTTADSPRPLRSARATRLALAPIASAALAAVLLAGCGSALEPTARPTAAPAADTGPSLADIDRALADLDHQLTDADHDVATPEGDIR